MLDVPTHSNVGDSAIWLGEIAALARLGVRTRYVADLETFSAARLREAVGDGPVLIHGGGNLGDLWPAHQRHREQVIAMLRDNRIVQLPQSIEFIDDGARARAGDVMRGHPSFTLLVRDERSSMRARSDLAVSAELCPDLAVCLGPLPRLEPPAVDAVWLLREDHEGGGHARTGAEHTGVDWLDEEHGAATRLVRRLANRSRTGSASSRLEGHVLAWAWRRAALRRFGRGCRLLCRARVVVTDRLHAHILCVLMGIPHVVLPDRFGKIEAFVDTWTAGVEGVHRCGSPSRARELVAELLARPRARSAG
jgi:pyruvyl transferase EpsO